MWQRDAQMESSGVYVTLHLFANESLFVAGSTSTVKRDNVSLH